MPGLPRATLVGVVVLLAGCQADRHSSAGFRLAPDGDPERGKIAFVNFGCSNCHEVDGANLPSPEVQPPIPVVLGGAVARPVTDGYLVASIIYPASSLRQSLARYPKDAVMRNGESRMPHFDDRMTVRQLTDIVAFLQSRYRAVRPLPEYYH